MKIRDKKTKERFIMYLMENPEFRFMQAVSIFLWTYVSKDAHYLLSAGRKFPTHKQYDKLQDTFFWECDKMLEKNDENQNR